MWKWRVRKTTRRGWASWRTWSPFVLVRPVRIIADWVWIRDWLKANGERCGRLAKDRVPEGGGASPNALFGGLEHPRFGFCMAAIDSGAAIKKAPGGRVASTRKEEYLSVYYERDDPRGHAFVGWSEVHQG